MIETNWERQLVNLHQTAGERQAKYWLARSFGFNNSHARRMRDWRLNKIERLIGMEIALERGERK